MTATITTRTRATGRRFVVRYRLGGRGYPLRHAGTFPTMREARIRRDLVAGEIAAGRNPAVLLAELRVAAPPVVRTFSEWAAAYRASRIDHAAETRKNLRSHVALLETALGEHDPHQITRVDVQEWITASRLQPSSLRRYLATLRGVLDYAGVDPNPARDARLRLPRVATVPVEPPSADEVVAMILHAPSRWRLALTALAETGLRVGELHALEWRDVDAAGSRFRVRGGKTRAARRWVAVPGDVLAEILRETPPDDRTAERRVFAGATPDAVRNIIDRACKAAGIAHYHPHDLRHRYASVQIARGVPVTVLAAQLGHTKNSMTLDTYSHVLLDG